MRSWFLSNCFFLHISCIYCLSREKIFNQKTAVNYLMTLIAWSESSYSNFKISFWSFFCNCTVANSLSFLLIGSEESTAALEITVLVLMIVVMFIGILLKVWILSVIFTFYRYLQYKQSYGTVIYAHYFNSGYAIPYLECS